MGKEKRQASERASEKQQKTTKQIHTHTHTVKIYGKKCIGARAQPRKFGQRILAETDIIMRVMDIG